MANEEAVSSIDRVCALFKRQSRALSREGPATGRPSSSGEGRNILCCIVWASFFCVVWVLRTATGTRKYGSPLSANPFESKQKAIYAVVEISHSTKRVVQEGVQHCHLSIPTVSPHEDKHIFLVPVRRFVSLIAVCPRTSCCNVGGVLR